MSVIKINKTNFEEIVLKNEKTVLIDFYADWCGPCKMVAPIVEEISEEYPDVVVGKINVDDEMELASATSEYFNMFDIKTHFVISAGECREFLKTNEIDMMLLDINLKDGSGFELCKEIREKSQIPILFISARQSDDDVLIALNIGGDDYIKKPYSLSVLLAKVKIVLKRMVTDKSDKTEDIKQNEMSHFVIIPDTMSVKIEGREVLLKAREFRLFEYLYNNKNRIVPKAELFSAVWGDAFYSDGTLNVHIRKLREKLEENPNEPKYIKTIWGTGYILSLEDK